MVSDLPLRVGSKYPKRNESMHQQRRAAISTPCILHNNTSLNSHRQQHYSVSNICTQPTYSGHVRLSDIVPGRLLKVLQSLENGAMAALFGECERAASLTLSEFVALAFSPCFEG